MPMKNLNKITKNWNGWLNLTNLTNLTCKLVRKLDFEAIIEFNDLYFEMSFRNAARNKQYTLLFTQN